MSANPISLDHWRGRGEWLHHAARPVFTRSEGVGASLLLIHGCPTASWDSAKVWPTLEFLRRRGVIPLPFQKCNVFLSEAKDLVMPRSFASLRMTALMIEE